MQKYFHQDIYLLEEEEELFQTKETMIEYIRDHLEIYCPTFDWDGTKLVSIQDWESKIILSYSVDDDDNNTETFVTELDYKEISNTWLISDLQKMVQNV
jgi:hypothetical protein